MTINERLSREIELRVENEPSAVTQEALRAAYDEWIDLFASRNELALEYAKFIRQNGADWYGWTALNQAILGRWSLSGLVYIKERAWRIARETP